MLVNRGVLTCQNVLNRLYNTVISEGYSMKKEYTIKELQAILGCSRTAIVKKIKTDEHNTDIKRYKDRYEVTQKDGQMAIIFDDAELEEERKLSKGFNTVINNGYNTTQNEDIIEIEPEIKENKQDDILNFTERYIERYTTLQETMYNELKERDKKILLLTTSENAKEQEYLKTVAENKTLKQRNTVLMVILGVIVTVLICVITYCVTVMTLSHNDTAPQEEIKQEQATAPIEQARVAVPTSQAKPTGKPVRRK